MRPLLLPATQVSARASPAQTGGPSSCDGDGRDAAALASAPRAPPHGSGPRIWVTARQHPGETMASWFAEGLLERLTDPHDPVARSLLVNKVGAWGEAGVGAEGGRRLPRAGMRRTYPNNTLPRLGDTVTIPAKWIAVHQSASYAAGPVDGSRRLRQLIVWTSSACNSVPAKSHRQPHLLHHLHRERSPH